ncbi:hypothetical protein [Lacisediminihabitans sp. H27-G8]|uniref:hypothetical protein n=1 Tax=Lacisediminihabitans sp. H27-G8 TaxID=3111909 RepID=UPI0038FCDE7F
MERIHYSGDSFVTGTEIAAAIFSYSEALAKRGSSATVTIPVREEDGSIEHARLLLGPASQIVSESEPSDFDELEDGELVASIRHATELLGSSQARSVHLSDVDHEFSWEM